MAGILIGMKHYIDVFHAEYLGMLHQYQFLIDEEQTKKLLEKNWLRLRRRKWLISQSDI